MIYKILVRTVSNEILKFTNVKRYDVIDGFVVFEDSKTGKTKRFSTSNCEIEESVEVSR